MGKLTVRDAISKGLSEAMDSNERCYLLGEDIGEYGGAYAVTKGFLDKYGEKRVRDMPIAESVIAGAAVGSAMGGLFPIAEIMTINFTLLAMDQIVNHAAKMRYMSNGQISVPMILRTVTGGGGGLAATHSQNFEGWYANVPGLKVVTPSNPYDALGLMRSCIESKDPVIYVEHCLLYSATGDVPEEYYNVPLGKSVVCREGQDVTIVTYGGMVPVCLEAADKLSEQGIEAEVIDLRSLRPLDIETPARSVHKTGRAVVVEENWKTGGFGAEISSSLQENAFDYLESPIIRISGEEVPMPYSRKLESAAIPDASKVTIKIKEMMEI